MADPSPPQLPVLPVRIPGGIVVSGRSAARGPGCAASAAAILLLAAACLSGAACTDRSDARVANGSIEVIDDAGRTVRLQGPARRIVSLVPARTDLILALGAADRLITRTAWDDDLRLAGLPSLGDALTPSVEWLIAQRPDLVIAWPDRRLRTVIERIENAGVAVYASRTETLEDVRRATAHLGTLLGLEGAADSLRRRFDEAIAAVRVRTRDRPERAVAWFIGLDPPMAAGPGTFADEMIGIAGGTNVFADAAALWPVVSLEQTLARQPDILIVTAAETAPDSVLEQLRTRPGWRALHAVRDGRVHVVDADLFNRPGPRLVEALRDLADLLQRS